MQSPINMSETDIQAEISQIPIYEAADVELRLSPVLPKANSFESLSSLESISSDLYDELSKISVQDVKPCVKVLPDLINFEIPSTSKMKDYHSDLSLSCTNDGQEGKNERETYKVSKNQTLSNFDLRNDCIADKSISNTLNRSLSDDCADTSNVSETVKREELDRYVDSTLRKSFSLSNTLTGSESEDVCDGQTLRECQSVCNSIIRTECSISDVTSRRVSMSSSVSGKETEDGYVFEAGDLNPSNILLGEGGQIILTYFYYYPDVAVSVSSPHRAYIAPELFARPLDSAVDDRLRHVCDFWSFGAILYELICGVRLGAGPGGIAEIKQHPYFQHIDWTHVYNSWLVPD
ncbi:unnamed protein product [Leptidea sinapis]|uniref:Protein kinase domain-containing protein n=1 Tax=Leptidea sinapis TaxID=189913 RepID=A0A5E4QC00_9NEOP|nr:unnamed protein product [Leptidea sinapis]